MTRIFIETGKRTTSEYVFCKAILTHWGIPPESYSIQTVGGKDNLPNALPLFRDNTLQGGKNIILFDADTESNGGGYTARLNEIRQILDEADIESEIFLFPNNSDDGDFETMLEQLVQAERHAPMLGCYRDYELCLPSPYLKPNRKGRLHTYISSMPMPPKQRKVLGQGEWQFENPEYWNLDDAYLNPLKEFVGKHIATP